MFGDAQRRYDCLLNNVIEDNYKSFKYAYVNYYSRNFV